MNEKRDLILIPKKVRVWIDVILGLLFVVGLVVYPIVKVVLVGEIYAEDCMVIGIGVIGALLIGLYALRGLRKGYIKVEDYKAPVEALKRLVVIVILVASLSGTAMAGTEFIERKLADTKTFVIEVMKTGQEGLHYGELAYRMPDGKTYWFSVDGKRISAKQFMVWLNKMDTDNQEDVKNLICAVRWMRSWDWVGGKIKFLEEMTEEEKAKEEKE